MNRYATIAILASLFIGHAMAANKPLHGRYTCKGTATQEVNIGVIGGGSRSSAIKGKMTAARGTFTVLVKTDGWKSIFSGYLEPDLQKVTWSSSNRAYKADIRDCYIGLMWQTGSGFQNKKGRSVTFSLEQAYYCGLSDAEFVDTYRLTCRR